MQGASARLAGSGSVAKGTEKEKPQKTQSKGKLSSPLTEPSSFLVHGPPLKSTVSQK